MGCRGFWQRVRICVWTSCSYTQGGTLLWRMLCLGIWGSKPPARRADLKHDLSNGHPAVGDDNNEVEAAGRDPESAAQARSTGRTVSLALLISMIPDVPKGKTKNPSRGPSPSSSFPASAANLFCVCTAAEPQANGERATNLDFPTRRKSPESCGAGVAAAGPCPPRLPPPDRQQ